jgi:syntaxin 5
LELGSVFGRLGELVADHQELTERLHENTLSTVENVDLSYGRLKRTLTQLQSNKTLALKLAAVGVTFTTFFIVFLA